MSVGERTDRPESRRLREGTPGVRGCAEIGTAFASTISVDGGRGAAAGATASGTGVILRSGAICNGTLIKVSPSGARGGYRDDASIYEGSPLVTVPGPYRLRRPNPRVAVLTNCRVASSGEAVVIGFRGRRDARSFGKPTRGLSTSNDEFSLTGGGTLILTTSTMADRTGHVYGGAVPPDEVVADPVQTVSRAIEWLRQ